jgi:hypothetical protein
MPRTQERTTYFTEIVLESASGRHPARISDISAGGCYIDTIVEVKVGEEIAFEVQRPNGESLKFRGTVAYHFAGMGFGLKYSDLTEEQSHFFTQAALANTG